MYTIFRPRPSEWPWMAPATVTGDPRRPVSGQSGFTLIEILVVVMLVSILAAVAVPVVSSSVEKARESALKENLFVMRKALDDYLADQGRYPESLKRLVEARYLRYVPEDPVLEEPSVTWSLSHTEYADGTKGIHDVHSTSDKKATDGSVYADW